MSDEKKFEGFVDAKGDPLCLSPPAKAPSGIFVLVLLLLMVPSFFYTLWAYGFLARHAWNWFIVPAYETAPMTNAQSIALAALSAVWATRSVAGEACRASKEKITASDSMVKIIVGAVVPWFALGLLYLTKLWFV